MDEDFSLARLQRLILSRNIFLRHDVDFFPECALQMAVLEHKLGVSSTFYIRPLESYADPQAAFASFTEIAELGFDLAPHVDLFMSRRAIVPDGYLRLCCESDLLSLSLALPMTRKVSFHAPPADALWRYVEGFEHAMTPEWVGRYVADSRGTFRRSPERALSTARPWEPLQLNLHPEWYFLSSEERESLRQREVAAP